MEEVAGGGTGEVAGGGTGTGGRDVTGAGPAWEEKASVPRVRSTEWKEGSLHLRLSEISTMPVASGKPCFEAVIRHRPVPRDVW
jgi:hypothetical protein